MIHTFDGGEKRVSLTDEVLRIITTSNHQPPTLSALLVSVWLEDGLKTPRVIPESPVHQALDVLEVLQVNGRVICLLGTKNTQTL